MIYIIQGFLNRQNGMYDGWDIIVVKSRVYSVMLRSNNVLKDGYLSFFG